MDECIEKPNICSGDQYCENTLGSYNCKPKKNGVSLGLKLGLGLCNRLNTYLIKSLSSLKLSFYAGIGGSLLVLPATGALTCWGRQRRNLKEHTQKIVEFKKRMFEQNGGPLLQQQISSQRGNSFRIFTEEELVKATEGFSDKNIIGRGGHGVVYLGKLEDNTAVAVKKSKMMNERESKEFAREMAILSQINHVNVVKILGCCV